jgi:hypothetical protein
VPVYAQYLIIRGAQWVAANDSGIRLISAGPISSARDRVNIVNSIKGKEVFQQFITVEHYNASEIIECYAAQNSSTNIDVYPYIFAIVLKRL